MEILSKKPLSLLELRGEIEKAKKRGDENYRVNRVEEYLNEVILLPQKDLRNLKKELEELNIPRLKEEHIVKIVDLLPKNEEDLKSILEGFVTTFSKDSLKKIINTVNKYVEKLKEKINK